METSCRACEAPAVILIRYKYYCAICALNAHHPRIRGRETPAEKKIREEKEAKEWPNK